MRKILCDLCKKDIEDGKFCHQVDITKTVTSEEDNWNDEEHRALDVCDSCFNKEFDKYM